MDRNAIKRNVGINGLASQSQFVSPLYSNAEIRRSLNLTPQQLERLDLSSREIDQRYANELSRLNSLAAEQRDVEIRRLQSTRLSDLNRASTGVFTPEQARRYQQLEYQYQGPAAFTDPAVRARLSLTEDQLRQFQLMQKNALDARSFLRNADGSIRNNGLAEYNAYRSRTNEQMDAILSQEQRDRWRGMIGEPYNFGPYVSSIYVR
jgi:hypothetical protein